MEKLKTKINLSSYINNQFQKESGPVEVLDSPVSKSPWLNLYPADVKMSKDAVKAASDALKEWSALSPFARSGMLRAIAAKMRANQAFLAEIMTLEIGKPIKESKVEVEYAAGYFDWYAAEGERVHGSIMPSRYPNKRLSIQYGPVGVCALITPWNFPLAIPGRKIAAALAAGCTVVLKPSPECPMSALAIAYMASEVGVPAGVVNVLIGSETEIGQVLLESSDVRKLSFTGSCEVGRLLFEKSARTLKKMTMELGGHAPLIVFDDADIDQAIEQTLAAKFRNSGQTCVAPNRLFVQSGIYDVFTERLVTAVRKLKVGDPRDEATDISDVLHPSVEEKFRLHKENALKFGGKEYLSGSPSIIGGINPQMLVYHEETFGPLLPLIRFTEDSEAIEAANRTEYGLAAYVFTQSLARADHAISALQYGVIGLNDGLPSAPETSFGGIKGSGFGREGGPHGIYDYLVEKCVSAQP